MGTPADRPPERVVLVVDDEETVCRYTARALADAGLRVLEAHDGEEAVALLASLGAAVWLVVSDVDMPRMTGVQLASVVAGRWPGVQVLLVSGQGTPPRSYEGRFLRKPFTAEELVAAVRGLQPGGPRPSNPVAG
jgi:DNA-binding NtrC family response regulator